MRFAEPVTHVYNPLEYAWAMHAQFLERFGQGSKQVVFLGMNPGPWGMAQTGVPFGEIAAVRDWMKLDAPVAKPPQEHPKRPVEGLACTRSEVSGRRLWGLFSARYPDPAGFFREHFVLNYCPLSFMEESGRNRTPDKLPKTERDPLYAICDEALTAMIDALDPEWAIGIGGFAVKRLEEICGRERRIGLVLHPSPASPAANRGWAQAAVKQLVEQGVWED